MRLRTVVGNGFEVNESFHRRGAEVSQRKRRERNSRLAFVLCADSAQSLRLCGERCLGRFVSKTILSLVILFALCSIAFAQDKPADKPEDATPKRRGFIKGKVMSDDGQPIEGANVNLNAARASGVGDWRQMQTDEEGNFVADGLMQGLYFIGAGSSSYVSTETALEPKFYRLGDVVNFTLTKGGVITGRVTNALGEPVIAAPIRVERIGDAEGRKIPAEWWFGQMRKTDDRGIYRMYGLPAGKYLVSVGGKTPYRYGPPTSYESDTPVFYPSSTRDGATEINVNVGEEVRGIDIRYRSEKGHSISGKVTGAPQNISPEMGGIQIELYRLPSHGLEMSAYIQHTDATKSFEFFSVPDGEYELEARVYGGKDKDSYKSQGRRVTVKGGDIANVELRLMMLGSIEAKIEWESTPEKDRKGECQSARAPSPDETIIQLVKDDPKPGNPLSRENLMINSFLDEKGELKSQGLEAATYRFAPQILDEAWYIKTVTAKPVSASQISNLKSPMAKPADLAKQGIALKPGEKRKDIILTLANGAASISGRVVSDKDQSLPSRLRVYVVPAEPEAAEDLLRYTEQKTKDGTFTFKNLAPGKYWLLARKVADDEPDAKRINPLAWEITTRKTLRAEAEAANVVITVTPCQKVNDTTLKFTPRK